MRVGDRVGIQLNFESNIVHFYINGRIEAIIDQKLEGKLRFGLSIKDKNTSVTITSGRLGFPQ